MNPPPLVQAVGVSKRFARRTRNRANSTATVAVRGVNLNIAEGEIIGLVGESGGGKSTLGRLLVGLLEPSQGHVYFDGEDLALLEKGDLRRRRRQFQILFQDPSGALNPRMRVAELVREPLIVHHMGDAATQRQRVEHLLAEVGLDGMQPRWPHQLSGGQRQRVALARALACRPRFLVADEPATALDTSVQARILTLLAGLQQEHSLALLLVAHDLALIEHLADRVGVMHQGELVEMAPTPRLFAEPQHPYTRQLLTAQGKTSDWRGVQSE